MRCWDGRTERSDRARVWVLPNPSGLNAHHQPADLARLFGGAAREGIGATTLETTALERTALRGVMASFAGPAAPAVAVRPAARRARLGLPLFGSNIESPEQVASPDRRDAGPDPGVLIATDEEGGDVTRLHAGDGSPHPGNAALGAVDDPARTAAVAAAIGRRAGRGRRSTSTSRRSSTSTATPTNPVIGVRQLRRRPGAGGPAHRGVRRRAAVGRGRCVRQALPRARRHRGRLAPRPAGGGPRRSTCSGRGSWCPSGRRWSREPLR